MKYYILFLILFYLSTVESVIVELQENNTLYNKTVWQTVSEYALGVWKYANITMTSLTVPSN